MKNSKIFLCRYIFLIMLGLTSNVFAGNTEVLLDVHNHWAEKEITYLCNNEVINGYEDGTFRPNQTIRLTEFLKVLIELSDYPLEIEEKLWPDSYLSTAKKNNWLN